MASVLLRLHGRTYSEIYKTEHEDLMKIHPFLQVTYRVFLNGSIQRMMIFDLSDIGREKN